MLRKGFVPVWVGILVLSGMFLLGQDTWPPPVESPQIDSVLPNPAEAGAEVTVTGTRFGAAQGTSLLLYDGSALAVTSWSATEIEAILPFPKVPGTYSVQVVLEGAGQNIVPHTITVPSACVVDADCNDGNVCNGPETCVSGSCQAGTALDCDDGNVCTDDTCDPVLGCVYGCTATGPADPCCADPACAGSAVCTPGESLLPDTGITTCYDNTTAIECPAPGQPFYGQDAQYTTNPVSYTVNGDGTVTDHVTGLMWQREEDNVTRTWANAISYCENLTLAGHSD